MAATVKSSLTNLARITPGSNPVCVISVASYSQDAPARQQKVRTPKLAAMKRGPGYRSSFSGVVATVFGSSGLVGRGVCNRLGKNGSQMILPYRGDHYKMLRLKVCGDLGQVLFTPFHLKDEDSIRRAVAHSNVVINLIGREWPTRNFSLKDVNVTGPATLARIARESGAKNFIHMSHVNAAENPERVFLGGGSDWLRTKWEGEQAVMQEFPDATIFRASDIYGQDDSFLFHYAAWSRRGFGGKAMPLWAKGESTVLQPVSMSDVASGIMAAINDPRAKGTIYEAVGPERFLLSDLMDFFHQIMNKDPIDWRYKRTDLRLDPVPFIKAFVIQNLFVGQKFFAKMSFDKLERTSLSDNVQGLPNLYDLGVEPASILDKAAWELYPLRAFGHYVPETKEEETVVIPPKPIDRVQERALNKAKKETIMGMIGLE